MQEIWFILKNNIYLIILSFLIILLFILYISNVIKLDRLRKSYGTFINKLGNGNNIEEILRKYIDEVEKVREENKEINKYCKNINNNIAKCTQKIGMIRYNAFKDTGSNLSFAVALLNEYNDGIVLNGIYSRDISNIYAKPIENGKSTYVLSEEEEKAIEKAIKGM